MKILKIAKRIINAGIGFCVMGITGTIYVFIFREELFMLPLCMSIGLIGGMFYED